MQSKIIEDKEFKALMPPQSDEEIKLLRQLLKIDGCRDPLPIWQGKGILLDGYTRKAICEELDKEYQVVEIGGLPDRAAAKEWIVRNQLGRRNLIPYQRYELVKHLESDIKKKAKEKQREAGGAVPQKSEKAPVDSNRELSELAGMGHDTYARARKIDELANDEDKELLRKDDVSINRIWQKVNRAQKRQERKAEVVKQSQAAPDGIFNVILCDPPWKYSFSPEATWDVNNHYDTLSLDELKELVVDEDSGKRVPDLAADDAILFLWATSPKLSEADELIQAWKFTYKTCLVWDKQVPKTGHWVRQQCEHLLIATKGNPPVPKLENLSPSVVSHPRGRHSAKPGIFTEIIEKMFPDFDTKKSKIELFARGKPRKGWTVWGNEAEPRNGRRAIRPEGVPESIVNKGDAPQTPKRRRRRKSRSNLPASSSLSSSGAENSLICD